MKLRALALMTIFTLTACGAGSSVGSIGGAPVATGGAAATGGSTAAPSPSASATQTNGSASPAPSAAPPTTTTTTNVCGGTNAPEPAIPFPSTADADAFYAQPASFANAVPGTILASRSVTFEPDGVPMTNAAWELKFVSCDIHEEPVAAVTTVVKPLIPATGSAAGSLFVENFAEDGLGPACAPSHSVTGSTADSNNTGEPTVPLSALTAGWTVMFPDYEGPSSEFYAGRLQGQIVLDSIRAAEGFAPLGLSTRAQVGINGYSGGADATSWAASLQHAYAPELNIVGIASGGTPASVIDIIDNIDKSTVSDALFGVVFAATIGANRAYPQFIGPLLNANGVAAATAIEETCVGNNADGLPPLPQTFYPYLTITNLDTSPNIIAAEKVLDLPQPGAAPVANAFVYHSITDELIPIDEADAMVAGWCAAGTAVEYYRDATGGDHITTEQDNNQNVIAYMASRFDALPIVVPPTTTSCN